MMFPSTVRSLGKMIALYITVLLLTALISPIAFSVLHSIFPKYEFTRYFDRIRYLGFLLALPVVWRWAGLQSWRDLGWGKWRQGVWLAVCGLVSMGLLAVWVRATTGSTVTLSWSQTGVLLLRGVGVGVVVALIEETIFRGIIQRAWVRGCGVGLGVVFAALTFAWLHGRPEFSAPLAGTLADGLHVAWQYLVGAGAAFTPMIFVNLVLLGVALGLLYVRNNSLWLPIGLHVGIVGGVVVAAQWAGVGQGTTAAFALAATPQATVLLLIWTFIALRWSAPKAV